MKIDGGCHCGQVSYEAEVDPEQVIVCHCTDCQRLSGAAYRTVVFTREDGFRLLSGPLKIYVKRADSGRQREQSFCPNCGTPIYATNVGEGPKVYGIRLGSSNQRDILQPKAQYWMGSAQDWVQDLSGLKKIGAE